MSNPKLKWVEIAENELGVDEEPGSKHDKRIIEYHASTTLKATEDEVPWCASFINWVFLQMGWIRTKSAAAKSFATWGVKLDGYRYGCVCVKTRTGGNHVFIAVGEKPGYILGLGGNQGNKVCKLWYPKNTIYAYRWPKEAEAMLTQKAEPVKTEEPKVSAGWLQKVFEFFARLFAKNKA